VADRFGIARNRAQQFHNDSEGIELNYRVLNETVSCYRAAPAQAKLSDNWGKKISENFRKRRK
jgi:hypothetical protein